jgi:hypothetical protein
LVAEIGAGTGGPVAGRATPSLASRLARKRWNEMAVLGLALALGATLGLLGVVLCVGIVAFPITSHMIKRVRPAMIEARRRLGLGMPQASVDA